MRQKPAKADLLAARLASRQYGVVSAAQLAELGLRGSAISRRLKSGRLHRLHRGVFAVGHAGLSREGFWMAAVLACGDAAALSHQSAAVLWGLLSLPGLDLVHVTVPGDCGRSRRCGIKLHRSTTLAPDQLTRRRNIPVTTPSRTLRDLRRTVPEKQFRAALRQAEVLGLPVEPELEPDHTRSELEARFLGISRRHRLPQPLVNARVGPYVVDFLWPAARLIVELDGYRYHRGRAAFEADRQRDLALRSRGYEVLRLTWRALDDGPAVASALRARLAEPR